MFLIVSQEYELFGIKEMEEGCREICTLKLAAKTTMCRLISQHPLQNNHNQHSIYYCILYEKSLSSISKIFLSQ